MNKTTLRLLVAILLAGAAFGYYFWQVNKAPAPQLSSPIPVPAAPPEVKAEPAPHYPVPENATAPSTQEPLPALTDSDAAIAEALSRAFGQDTLSKLLVPDALIRRIVATVDNLPRQNVAQQLLPTRPVDGKFLVTAQAEQLTIAPENAARYTPYVRLAEMTDAKQLVAAYFKFYPLFQRAYQDLGYPNGYFNNRLVAVIDHLIAAPEINAPIALVQPKILYKFADPELEARSAGHKIMLRMGRENASKVKAKLQEIRGELVGGVPAQQTTKAQ